MTLKEALKLYEGQEGVKEIKSLIKKGINARYLTDRKEDKNFMQNMCPIHIAARFGYKEIVKALIENGADLNIKSGRYGFMPLYLACENNYEEIIDILIKNGANLGLEPNHKVWRLDLPYREEEYFMERTSNYFQFVYEEEDLSEPCEITTDVPFYFENMLPYSTIYVQSGYEKWKHKIYFYKKYNDFYGEDSYCSQYNKYARANRFMKGGKFPHDDYFHFSIYQQEITDGKNYFIITHFALMSRKIDKEFILWLVENFNSIPIEEGTMNSFDDLNKIKLCKKGVTYYLSYNGSLYAFMTMDKYIFVVCEIRDLTKRSKKFMRLAIYMTGERYSINRKPELLEEEEEDRIKRMKITIKKYSRRYLKFIKEVAKYLEIKGYKKNKDYKIYSDENIIENMAEFYGYNNNYVRNIKIIRNDIVSLSSNYTDKDGVAYYLGLTVSSYNEKLKKKTIKIKNAVKKFMFYKFKEKEDFGEYRLFYKIRVKKYNPEEIAKAMIKLYGILKSKKIKYLLIYK